MALCGSPVEGREAVFVVEGEVVEDGGQEGMEVVVGFEGVV